MDLGRWAHLGHRLGECWVDDVNSISYIHIPKNASSFIKGVLMASGGFWRHSETLVNSNENLVILRDPIDRWCSGITQYLYNNKLDLSVDTIFDRITFDDHTDLQTYFLQGVDLTKTTFLQVDSNLRSNMNSWIVEHGYRTNVDVAVQYNASADDERATTKNFYTTLLDDNPSLVDKLKEHFKQDFELFDSVDFYNK